MLLNPIFGNLLSGLPRLAGMLACGLVLSLALPQGQLNAQQLGSPQSGAFPPGRESSAKVLQITGRVSLLRGQEQWALNTGDWVANRQTIITGADGFAVLQVQDGSRIEVFPNSHLVFRNNAGDTTKELLDLFLGRVKVFVEKFGGKPNPNRVTTPTAVISVRGTIFDVQIEDDDATTLVSVEEGVVVVKHNVFAYTEPKTLNAGEYVRVYRNQPLANKSFDKGGFMQKALRAAADIYYNVMLNTPRTTGGAGGGASPAPLPPRGGVGDTAGGTPTEGGATTPPPATPPPATAPPPPPSAGPPPPPPLV